MTDLLLASILIVLLIQVHVREKNIGRYGKLYVFLKKRVLRYLVRRVRHITGKTITNVRGFRNGRPQA